MKQLMGIAYGRGCTTDVITGGPALAPDVVRNMFPGVPCTIITPDDISVADTMADRFGENALIQAKIYDNTPATPHVMIGGDHSVNFGHVARIADEMRRDDLCMVYIDAHLDIHTPESSRAQASGAPHGTNVRALLGDGDVRWLTIPKRAPVLRPGNVFYIATRSGEGAEGDYIRTHNMYVRPADRLLTMTDVDDTIAEIQTRIAGRPYVVSFDFDAIDPKYFGDVLVPEDGGMDIDMAMRLVTAFAPGATSFEFVEYAPSGDVQSAKIAHDLIAIALNT